MPLDEGHMTENTLVKQSSIRSQ